MATKRIDQLGLDVTTPLSSDNLMWPTTHANTGRLMINPMEPGTNPDGTANPTISMGYNTFVNGSIDNTIDNMGAAWKIEGNWYSGSEYVMEGYLEFNDDSGAAFEAHRPFMATFNKDTGVINLCRLSGGAGTGIKFNELDADLNTFEAVIFEGGNYTFNSPTSTGNITTFAAPLGGNIVFRFAPEGTDASATPFLQFGVSALGGSKQHSYTTLTFADGIGAAVQEQKLGRLIFRADENQNGATMQLGSNGAGTADSLVEFTSVNMGTSLATLSLVAVASQTGASIRVDGTTDAGVIEADKWQLLPKGSISVKPSGGAVTAPQTGSTTITPTYANKPGTGTSGTPTWFPMLSTTGSLFWVPGFAD